MILKTAFQKLFRAREQAARMRPGADDGCDPYEKPFLDHLEDLRHTLMKIGGTLAISTILCFIFHPQIFELIQVPAKVKMAALPGGGVLWDKLDLITLSPPEFIVLMLKLSFYSGLIITFPFTVYFLFQFIIPGLREAEKRAVIPGVGIGFVLFLVGASFAFFFAVPVALRYFYIFENERISNLDPAKAALAKPLETLPLVGFDGEKVPPAGSKEALEAAKKAEEAKAAGAEPAPSTLTPELKAEIRDYLRQSLATAEGANFALRYDESRDRMVLVEAKGGKSVYRIGEYINFITRLVLVFGLSFQLPIIVTILVKLELLTARVMRDTRNYAWVFIVVAAAILTPPDVLSLGLLAGPMVILYEICVIIASLFEKARERKERAEERKRQTRLERLHSTPPSELSEEEKAELHRAEIEQYEREHAHLYGEDSEHVSRDSLHGEGASEPGTGNHDESWHEDGHYWHDDAHYHDYHDPHHGEEGDKLESDHAEPEDLTPGEPEGETGEADKTEEAEAKTDPWPEYENCAPEGPVVDLNHASLEELQTLPGIGPKMAEVIAAHRPYETFDDLDRIPGLGPDKIRRITERIMLG
jgi:Tat protein translocase TatC